MVFHDLIIYCNVLPYFHLRESMKMFGIQRHIFFNTISNLDFAIKDKSQLQNYLTLQDIYEKLIVSTDLYLE